MILAKSGPSSDRQTGRLDNNCVQQLEGSKFCNKKNAEISACFN